MALVPNVLAEELNSLADLEGLNPEDIVKIRETNLRLAIIITNYLKTAQVVGQGTGANAGGPITTVVTGTLQ